MSIDITSMLDSFPEGWRPNPGDKLVGVVIGLETRAGEYGEYPIVTVRTDAGQDFAFHAYHTVAERELAKLQPRVGDRIGIAYHGLHLSKGYERYRIVIVRRAGEVAAEDAPTTGTAMQEAGNENEEDEDRVPF
jgi:hypothetical protein